MDKKVGLESRLPILLTPYLKAAFSEKKAVSRIMELIKADPSGESAKYMPWIVRMDLKGEINHPSAIKHLEKLLIWFEEFKKVKNSDIPKDINQYPDLETLQWYLDEYKKMLGRFETQREKEERIKKEGFELLGEAYFKHKQGVFTVYRIVNPHSTKGLCRNSGWCITHPSSAARYLEGGYNLYLVNKNGKNHMMVSDKFKEIRLPRNAVPTKEDYAEMRAIFKFFIKDVPFREVRETFHGIPVVKDKPVCLESVDSLIKTRKDNLLLRAIVDYRVSMTSSQIDEVMRLGMQMPNSLKAVYQYYALTPSQMERGMNMGIYLDTLCERSSQTMGPSIRKKLKEKLFKQKLDKIQDPQLKKILLRTA